MTKTKVTEPEKKIGFDPDKCAKIFEELVEIFQNNKLTVGEIVVAVSNLLYTLGASIEGHEGKGPALEELEKAYYSNPSIGVAMMLEAFTISTWFEDYQTQVLDKIEEKTEDSS